MTSAPRDQMESALEDLLRTANLACDAMAQALEALREDKPIPEDVIAYMQRIGRQHEDWIGHSRTARRTCFYPKGWDNE